MIETIRSYEHNYLDEREKNDGHGVILSHLFLLLGCTIPIMTIYALKCFDPSKQSSYVYLSLSGLFFVGLGDSTAALVGRTWGETKWWFGSHKTTEGSAWCFFSIMLVKPLFLFFLGVIPDVGIRIIELCFSVFVATILEALTK